MTADAYNALVAGIQRAATLGLTKPHDVANSISVALDEARLKIVRLPAVKPTRKADPSVPDAGDMGDTNR